VNRLRLETEQGKALADEHQHLIEEALAKDQIVLSDRWLDSSLAYQGFGRGLDLQWLRAVSLGFIHRWPDRTFVLDLPPEVGLARRTKLNRLDRESLEFHRRVRSGYLTLAREEPERFQIIDAEASEEAVQAALRSALEPLLEAFKLC
jgi:dTMP kinase